MILAATIKDTNRHTNHWKDRDLLNHNNNMKKYMDIYAKIINIDSKIILESYIKGKTITDIFYDFGIPNRIPSIQNKIDELTILLDREEIKEAEVLFKELYGILGENDPAIIEAQTTLNLISYNSDKTDIIL